MARGDDDGELLTPAAHAQLESELAELEGPKRSEAVQAIATARAHGDLSENFEYHAAKNEQGLLEARIRVLRHRLQHATIVDEEAAAARGVRVARGEAGRPGRRPGGEAGRAAAVRRRALARRRLYRERPQVPPARQPRPAAGRDRGVRAAPFPPDRAHRAQGDRDARQLRDEAPLGPAARDHTRARPGAGAHDRRPQRPPLPALPPGSRALHAGDAEGARGGLRAPARADRTWRATGCCGARAGAGAAGRRTGGTARTVLNSA